MRCSFVLVGLGVLAVASAGASCSDDDPRYGAPSSIKGKEVPGVVATDFFTGPYDPTANAPAKTASQTHREVGQVALDPTVRCFSCHGGMPGQPGSAAAFAGYARVNGTNAPAAGADIVVASGGTRMATKAGSDGFFWIAAAAGKLGPDARVAVRDAQGRVAEMKQALPSGGCTAAGCHGPTEAAGLVVVPE